ncbi:MAG: hypothetical protein M3335_05020, partial [Actinomycetota bacterium]|nr:hypothetical protein [Actinomycetota bacterium]
MAEGGPEDKARVSLFVKAREALRLLAHPRKLWREHRPWAIALIVGAVALVVGGFVAYEALKRPADVHNQEVIQRFEPQKPPEPKEAKTVNWP